MSDQKLNLNYRSPEDELNAQVQAQEDPLRRAYRELPTADSIFYVAAAIIVVIGIAIYFMFHH